MTATSSSPSAGWLYAIANLPETTSHPCFRDPRHRDGHGRRDPRCAVARLAAVPGGCPANSRSRGVGDAKSGQAPLVAISGPASSTTASGRDGTSRGPAFARCGSARPPPLPARVHMQSGADRRLDVDAGRDRNARQGIIRSHRPWQSVCRGSDTRVDCVVVTVGDHRTVCSPQPAAADRRSSARGAALP
jgi:hypothetical protein